MKNAFVSCLACLIILAAGSACFAVPPYLTNLTWTPVGPGGGGAQYNPALAPTVPPALSYLMYGFCDMGGVYRSLDGGHNWTMLTADQAQAPVTYGIDGLTDYNLGHFNPVFHPTKGKIGYVGLWSGIKGTTDNGYTWSMKLPTNPVIPDMPPSALAVAANNPQWMFACRGGRIPDPANPKVTISAWVIYRSFDGGATWTLLPNWWRTVQGPALDLYIDPFSTARDPLHPELSLTVYASSANGMYRSLDSGNAWSASNGAMPGIGGKPHLIDFNAGTARGVTRLYVTLESSGVWTSVNQGGTWTAANNGLTGANSPDHREIGVCQSDANIAYVGTHENGGPTIYKTTNGGANWSLVLTKPGAANFPVTTHVERDWMTGSLGWNWGEEPHEIEVCPSDPNKVAFSEDGRTFRSDDGGNNWFCCNNKETAFESNWWTSVGFETTTNYHVHFAPWDHNRAYITYTDIGFFRSEDRGVSWRYAANLADPLQPIWRNTFYDVTFDPKIPGKMWAVASNDHDAPHEKVLRNLSTPIGPLLNGGGIVVSTDYGASWRPLRSVPDGVPTSIVVDPASPVGRRTLYAAVLHLGVLKSMDDGATWTPVNTGFTMYGPDGGRNLNAWMLKRMDDGTLYCAITMAIDQYGNRWPGALYRSTNGGALWTKVNAGAQIGYIFGFDVDSQNQRKIYVASFTCRGNSPGLYRTTDGGATWMRTLTLGDTCDASIDPQAHNRVYATIEQGENSFPQGGMYISEDWGLTWNKMQGLPFEFYGPKYVSYDPDNSEQLYVTTFGGGVWKTVVPHIPPSSYQFAASDAETSATGTTTWTNKVSLRFTPSVTDDWLIIAMGEYKCSTSGYGVLVRMMVDGVAQASSTVKPVSPNDYSTFMTAKVINLATGNHTANIDFAGSSASAVVRLRNTRIFALRKGSLEMLSAAPFEDALRPFTVNTTPSECASLSWTPATPGDYLLLWSAELQGNTLYNTRVQSKLNGVVKDDVSVRAKDNANYVSAMGVTAVPCAAAAQRFSLTVWKGGGSVEQTQTVRRPRLIAIRLTDGRLNGFVSGVADAETTTSSTAFVPKLTKNIALSSATKCLMLSSLSVGSSSVSWPVESLVTGNTSLIGAQPSARLNNLADYLPFGSMDVRVLGPGNPPVSISYRSTSSASTRIKFAKLVIIPLL
jgi:photosystem II stability/assembly factor-like uncharacterized protein